MGKKAEPTPGPWVARECIGQVYFQIVPEQIPSDSGLYQIGDVCASRHGLDGGEHIYGGEQEANAHLIAAAPRMKSALEQAVTSMLDSGYSTDSPVVRECQQALADARGEGNE